MHIYGEIKPYKLYKYVLTLYQLSEIFIIQNASGFKYIELV